MSENVSNSHDEGAWYQVIDYGGDINLPPRPIDIYFDKTIERYVAIVAGTERPEIDEDKRSKFCCLLH